MKDLPIFLTSIALFILSTGFGFAESDKEGAVDSKLAAVEKEIEAAVEAGKITREEGDSKLAYVRKHGLKVDSDKNKWEEQVAEIKLAEALGEITPEEAKEKFIYLKKAWAERKQENQWNPNSIRKEIADALAAGELTKEEAAEKLEWLSRKEAAAKGGE